MNKYIYKIYGLLVESEIYIKELIQPSKEMDFNKNIKSDVLIKYDSMPFQIKQNINEGRSFSFKKDECWFLIEDIGIYRICNGNIISVEKLCNDEYKIQSFILGSSFGCLFIQRNMVALHGGTILINNKALVITGDSGAGKSTLTSNFRVKGYKFLSDDISVTDVGINGQIIVNPAYPQQKLCRDSAIKLGLDIDKLVKIDEGRDKFAVPSKESFITESKTVAYMCEVGVRNDELDKVEIKEVLGIQKMKLINKNIYRTEIARDIGIKDEYFKQILRIAKQIKYFKVIRPKNSFTVNEQMQLILENL